MKQKSIFKTVAITLAISITLPVLIMTDQASAQTPVGDFTQNSTYTHPIGIMNLSLSNRKGGMPMMMEKLNLNTEQKSMIQEIRSHYQPQMQKHMEAMIEGRLALLKIAENGLDGSLINKHANSQGGKLADLIILHGQIRKQIYTVLTLEQQKLFEETLNKKFM